MLYISAFGLKPLNPIAGIVCGTAAILGSLVLIGGCDGKLYIFFSFRFILKIFSIFCITYSNDFVCVTLNSLKPLLCCVDFGKMKTCL